MKFLFFYSSQECPYSVNMIKIMETNGILSLFEKYNVWDLEPKNLVNLGLKHIPAIVLINNNGQRNMWEGKNSFQWLENFIKNRRRSMEMAANANRMRILEKNMELSRNDGISDFSKAEMTGHSDDYAFLATDIAQPKNHVGIGLQDQAIVTLEEQGKLSKQETSKNIDIYKKMRDNQTTQFKQVMKEKQAEAVYENRGGNM